jgi:hypothetical protein
LQQFQVKKNSHLGHWSSKHEPFANFILGYAMRKIPIGIQVTAKSAGSENPDFTPMEVLLYEQEL